MPGNKRFAALIICVAAAVPMFLSAFFLGGRTALRYTMQEKMQTAELVSLEIPGSAILWMDEGKELLIDGRMFDVRSIRYAGDTCLLTGLFDEDETTLYAQLSRSEEGRQGAEIVPGLLQVCLGITAIYTPDEDPCPGILAAEPISYGRAGQDRMIRGQSGIVTPPPEKLPA
jgi:hypothetical protein